MPDSGMAACPACGWYARLNTYVEVAPEWEAAMMGQEQTASPSHTEVWLNLLPQWVWALLGTTLAVAAASFGVRYYTLDDDSLRTTWAVTQLLGGFAVALALHCIAFFVVCMSDPDLGIGDIVINPLRAWMRIFSGMPKRFWLANSANVSLSASICAAAIIGGIPYDNVWDWGFSAPVKKNLLAAVASKMPAGEGDEDNLEDAVEQFAQDAAVDGLGDDKAKKRKTSSDLKRKKIDALIIGYTLERPGVVKALLLATEVNGKLVYAGRVTPLWTEEEEAEMPVQLTQAHSPRPFVTVPAKATWLQPRFTCRVSYEKRVESGMLQGLLWEEMLSEIKLPW